MDKHHHQRHHRCARLSIHVIIIYEDKYFNSLWYSQSNILRNIVLTLLTGFFSISSGLSFLFGTYVMCRMEQYFKSPAAKITDINELIIFEQRINLFNGVAIFMQLIRIWSPQDMGDNYFIMLFSLLMEFLIFFAACHRAFGSLVIAGVR